MVNKKQLLNIDSYHLILIGWFGFRAVVMTGRKNPFAVGIPSINGQGLYLVTGRKKVERSRGNRIKQEFEMAIYSYFRETL
jgi:hypothetical protein